MKCTFVFAVQGPSGALDGRSQNTYTCPERGHVKREEAKERAEASILTVPKRWFCPEFKVAHVHVPLQLTWRARYASDARSLPEHEGPRGGAASRDAEDWEAGLVLSYFSAKLDFTCSRCFCLFLG